MILSLEEQRTQEAIARRIRIARAAKKDPEKQRVIRAYCSRDLIAFTNDWVWTYDPRTRHKYIPFDLWPKQIELLEWLRDTRASSSPGEPVIAVLEKSRDGGASWLIADYFAHAWVFEPGFRGGIGSRKLEYVDKLGDPKSLFWKVRFILDQLPVWMLHPEWVASRKKFDREALIEHPKGATLSGEGGDNIGRGDRTSVYAVDESAFVPRGEAAAQALSATSDFIIHISTPNSAGDNFARMAHNPSIPKFTLHWKDNPRYNAFQVFNEAGEIIEEGHGYPTKEGKCEYPWYERLKKLYPPSQIAREWDINYSSSLDDLIVPYEWARAAVGLVLPPCGTGRGGLDFEGEGAAYNSLAYVIGPHLKLITQWMEDNEITKVNAPDPVQTVRSAISKLPADADLEFLAYDKIGVGLGAIGAWARQPEKTRNRLKPVGINTGTPPSKLLYGEKSLGKDLFVNLKAELWWRARMRFQRTFEYVFEGIEYPPEDLISLEPGEETERFIGQLCNVRFFRNDLGRIKVETKEMLAERNVPSPDLADAFVLTELPNTLAPSTALIIAGRDPRVVPKVDKLSKKPDVFR